MQGERTRIASHPGLVELEEIAQEIHRLGQAARALEDRLGSVIYALSGAHTLSAAERSLFFERLASWER
jgi:hypothetical protein